MRVKKKRRWYQISLRAFLVGLTVLCAWLGMVARKASMQKAAVTWVTENSGTVWYDFHIDNPKGVPIDTTAQPPGPLWLRELVGLDFFAVARWGKVEEVSSVSHLGSLPHLKELSVDHSSVNDVTPLKNLKRLKRLFLRHSPITDVTPLASLSDLEHLSLNDTDVRDVSALSAMTNLKSLNLHRTLVRERDYQSLKESMPNCGIVWSRRQ